jgi:hypothetical protein
LDALLSSLTRRCIAFGMVGVAAAFVNVSALGVALFAPIWWVVRGVPAMSLRRSLRVEDGWSADFAKVTVTGHWAGMKSIVALVSDGSRWSAMDDHGEPWRPSGEFRVFGRQTGPSTTVGLAVDSARAYSLKRVAPQL